MALGALRADILREVLSRGASFAASGTILGLAIAAGLAQLLRTMLLGVSPFDPLTYGGTALLLLAVCLIASFVPARRLMLVAGRRRHGRTATPTPRRQVRRGCIVRVMSRSIVASVMAFAVGVLPVVHDVCGPDCAMGDAPVVVATATEPAAEAECPLHAAEDKAPTHEPDGCTHDHGIVRDAPESTSALAPSLSQPLQLPVATFLFAVLPAAPRRPLRTTASRPIARSPRSIALRI